VSAIHPTWALEGGRVAIRGEGFSVDGPRLPVVRFGSHEARVVHASPRELGVLVPAGLDGGPTPVCVDDAPGGSAVVEIGAKLADELHMVDSPVFDRQGQLYVTFSGTRGERVQTALFRIAPTHAREALPAEILNPTSLAVDRDGRLYVSSRFEGTVYRVGPDGAAETFATDLGIPCGLAFGPDGRLYVGDRSGSIMCVTPEREIRVVATLPPSVAAYHLAMGPDGALYVTAPTLSSQDGLYRVELDGRVSTVCTGFGRPQGLAFDSEGRLYVVEALAGASGVFRLRIDEPAPALEHVVAGVGLVGAALDPSGGLVVATGDAVYRFDVPLRPPAV
jgi:sugar lactone lactonase YvrE